MMFRATPIVMGMGLLLAACASPSSEIHLAPLFSHHSVPGWDRAEAAGGILSREQTPQATSWTLSPLLWRQVDANGKILADFFYPLGRYEKDPSRPRTATRILPFFWYQRELRRNGVEETDWFLFPIVRGTSSDGSDESLGIFPFWGKVRNFMVLDKVEWLLFPLFVRTTQEDRTHTFLMWPFFGWREGGETSGWHAWPVYGQSQFGNHYKRHYFLWPFFTRTEEQLQKPHPLRGWMLWPLYGVIRQDDFEAHTFLWPFFAWASRPSTGYESWSLMPFLKFENSPEKEKEFKKVWPFWMRTTSQIGQWTSWMWPLFWHHHSELGEVVSESFRFIPFWFQKKLRSKDKTLNEEWHFWPLARKSVRADGSEELRIPSPGMAPIVEPDQLARNLGPWLELWTDRKRQREDWSHKRAWGNLYHEAQSEQHHRWSLPVLGGRWIEPDGTRHFSFLLGLLRWQKASEEKAQLEPPAFPGPGWPKLFSSTP
ncbi:MAG: hypothetical protein CMJ96_01860 [Planctomycetes bacterium]|nr:hypothetical protein [Planctomycetota bacterium]